MTGGQDMQYLRYVMRGASNDSLRVTLALALVIGTVLLAAGCVTGQTGEGKNMGNVPSTVLVTSIPSLKQIESPIVPEEGYYWIKMDPISDKYTEENFTITSTTNLSAGDEILVQVYPSTFFPGPKMQSREFYGATGTVLVIQGRSGINTILFNVNSSTLYNSTPLKPDEYIVTEDSVLHVATCSELFRILPTSGSAGNITEKSKRYIDWDKLDIPHLILNNSMQPVIPDISITLSSNRTEPGKTPYGTIILFSADGIVRFFDKNGTQTAAYYDYSVLHSTAVPNGATIGNPVGNVTTVTYGGERILMEIYEAGN